MSWAFHSIHNTTSKCSPAQLVFNRDVILDTQTLINWKSIRDNKHNIAIRNNVRKNSKRIEHECKIGDQVLLDKKHRKLNDLCEGPCDITHINSNRTITLQKGNTETTVNVR